MEWMFMPLRRYAEFSGRSRRQEFWMFMLLQFLIWTVALVAIMMMGVGALSMAGVNPDGTPRVGGLVGLFASLGIFFVIFAIIWLALLIPSLAVQVRRLHDSDRSGWWLMIYWGPAIVSWFFSFGGAANQSASMSLVGGLFSLVGFFGSIALLVFWCLPGTNGPNKYGPDPLGGVGDLSQTFQ